jgi:hypothetical protein
MAINDDGPVPPLLGRKSDGHWSVETSSGIQQEQTADYSVSGPVIRLMWDYGVELPLWDADGLLPEEADWLRQALGLSDRLIDDLRAWGLEMERLDAEPRQRTEDAHEVMKLRGQELALRLQQEVGSRFRINYRPW